MTFDEKVAKLRSKFPNIQMPNGPNAADATEFHHADRPAADCLHDIAVTLSQGQPPLASAKHLADALEAIRYNAAPAIDGWSRDLLQCILDDREMTENFLIVLKRITPGGFGRLVMSCILASRVVPIPKPCGGVRPISISHVFLKLAGGIAMRMGRDQLAAWQYAEHRLQGTTQIIHKCRDHLHAGRCIAKFDLRNAFGSIPRALCAAAVSQAKSPMLLEYFRTVYLQPTHGVVFGPDGRTHSFEMTEGVRQGDATSAYIFCRALDVVVRRLLDAVREKGLQLTADDVLCYMDDLTVVVRRPEQLGQIVATVKDTLESFGLRMNEGSSKSAAIMPHPVVVEGYTVHDAGGDFELLGASLSMNPIPFFERQRQKQERFFSLLSSIPVHPALLYNILRTCGNPRIRYLCSVMPPSDPLQALTLWFDETTTSHVGDLILNRSRKLSEHSASMVFHPAGLGFVRYAQASDSLYNASYTQMLLAQGPHQPATSPSSEAAGCSSSEQVLNVAAADVQLAVPDTRRRDVSSQWMSYTGRKDDLPREACRYCLAERLGCLPTDLLYPVACDCEPGLLISDDEEFIKHTHCCPRGRFTAGTGAGYTRRHDTVKHRALLRLPRTYGIPCTDEPRMYEHFYEDGSAGRPDVLYHTARSIAIDLSIVCQHEEPGQHAHVVAQQKIRRHQKAVEAAGHIFVPFIVETTGWLHSTASELIHSLAVHCVDPWLQRQFIYDMHRTLSVSLAEQKAEALAAATRMAQLKRLKIFGELMT